MTVFEYAKSFIGLPYIWGANGGGAFDCSGFIQELLAFRGIDPRGDQTADQLVNIMLIETDKYSEVLFPSNEIKQGDFIFYGINKATHVAMVLNDDPCLIIEAGGGGSRTDSIEEARKLQAHVRVRPLTHRRDILRVMRLIN